jgi:hypothetical protein
MRAVVLTCLYAFPRPLFSASARLPFHSVESPDDVVGSHFLLLGGRYSVWPWTRLSDVATYCGNPASDGNALFRTDDGCGALDSERTPLEASQRLGVGQNKYIQCLGFLRLRIHSQSCAGRSGLPAGILMNRRRR